MTEDNLSDDIPSLDHLHGPGKSGDLSRSEAYAQLLKDRELIEQAHRQRAEQDFRLFAYGLSVVTPQGPKILQRCAATFQRAVFDDIAEPLQQLRTGTTPTKPRWWIERTKKASKDADLAIVMLWLIAFPVRPFFLQVGAGNREQAGIVKQRITHILHLNPWLNAYVEVIQSTVRSKRKTTDGSPMAWLQIMSSDGSGAHGGTPDLLVVNELSHIGKWEFAETLMDNASGVANGMVIIATNAGFIGSHAWGWRTNAMTSNDWEVHVWSKPAPWHKKEFLEDARRRNTHSRYMRLWRGKWVSGRGDALSEEDIDACFALDGPLFEAEPGWTYIAGLDIGIKQDHSGFVVLAVDYKNQVVKTAFWKRWIPQKDTGEVDLQDVEDTILMMSKVFRLWCVLYDPHQAKFMAQRLMRMGTMMREMTFSSPTNLTVMALAFVQAVESGKLKCYDDEDQTLRNDFAKFHIAEKSYGYKLEATSDINGHADVGTALIIALPAAIDLLGGGSGQVEIEGDLIANEADLTREEVAAMPDELREIYEMESQFEKKKTEDKWRDPDEQEDYFGMIE